MTHRRRTIGLIFPELVDFGPMCWGAFDAAAEHGANVVCFQGNPLQSPIGFSAQANALYDLITPQSPLDGLVIWTGWLGQFVGAEAAARFCQRFAPLPIVSISQHIEGLPCILGDNAQGMRDVVRHLVEVHGCRRLALITGPPNHLESADRFQVYLNLLAEYGLDFDPALVVGAQFTHEAGVEAIGRLVECAQAPFDAVITGDDFVALGAIEGLQACGLRVPEDVAVVGFDDAPHAQATIPPLTTVRQSAYDQGYQGASLLLAQLAGQAVPLNVRLPMRLIVRQSCGCSNPAVLRALASIQVQSEWVPGTDATQTSEKVVCAMLESLSDLAERISRRQVELLCEAFLNELSGEAPGSFVAQLEALLHEWIAARVDVFLCQDVLSAMQRAILPRLDDHRTIIRATRLWTQARVLVGETALRIQAQRHLKIDLQTRLLREIGQEFITTFDLAGLYALLAQELPKIGILGCWLVRYEDTPRKLPEQAALVAGFEGGQALDLPAEGQRFSAESLALDWLNRRTRPYQVVIEPLYFRDRQLGLVIFEPGPRDGSIYEALRGYLTTALYGALLFEHNLELYRQALQARAEAEKADQLKTLLLANVSHDLRTPLNVILGYTETALNNPRQYGITLPTALSQDLQQIRASAEYLTRIINDLLDLSRAEINELALYPEMVDPGDLLRSVFENSLQGLPATAGRVTWHLRLPPHLPLIQADPDRLRQVLFNLLSNARNYTDAGLIVLGADVLPPYLHLWVQDTGIGIPAEEQERIFEPFFTGQRARERQQGIGLGLSITRQLVMLHRGLISLESAPGQGSTFHVYLPLPSLSGEPIALKQTGRAAMLLLSSQDTLPAAAAELAQQQGWEIVCATTSSPLNALLGDEHRHFVALAWDLSTSTPADWNLVQQIQAHSQLCRLPLLLFGPSHRVPAEEHHTSERITQVMIKPLSGESLLQAIARLLPRDGKGHVLAIDDDPQALALYQRLVQSALPHCSVALAEDGLAALHQLEHGPVPSLVILDLVMPAMDGFAVLEQIRAIPATRSVPVLVLSGKLLTADDIRRLSQQDVLVHSKGVLDDAELESLLRTLVRDGLLLDGETSALVKRTLAYLHEHYSEPILRRDICRELGISENYLSRLFHQELGVTLVEYLNRYRLHQAKRLLSETHQAITAIAQQVGFDDPAYFSRVFARHVGMSPRAYRRTRNLHT